MASRSGVVKAGHLMRKSFSQTETFIWQYLRHFQQVHPVIFSLDSINEDQFPLPNGTRVILPGLKSRFTPRWFEYHVRYRVFKEVFKEPYGVLGRIDGRVGQHHLDLLHAHYGPMGIQSYRMARRIRLPLITTFYGSDISSFPNRPGVIEEYQGLFAQGARFLVEGPAMKRKLLDLGCPESKITIQHIAIVPDACPFRIRRWDGNRPLRLLFVGRFVEKKGIGYALSAVAKVLQRDPIEIEWHIVGDGPLRKPLYRQAVELGLERNIKWLGYLPHQATIKELDWADLFVHPSITSRNGDSEGGAPTILLEAQACGLPILSTTHADIPYVTAQGQSALLAPERDPEVLATNLQWLMGHCERWEAMGNIGRQHVEDNHDVRREVIKLEQVYQEVI